MVTFRNNSNRRNNFRRGDRNFKNNSDRSKYSSNFSNNDNFQRKAPNRNNHNAPKLIEKYNNLAREALSSGDKILSESYFQHADHFTRVLNEKGIKKSQNVFENDTNGTSNLTNNSEKKDEVLSQTSDDKSNKIQSEVN